MGARAWVGLARRRRRRQEGGTCRSQHALRQCLSVPPARVHARTMKDEPSDTACVRVNWVDGKGRGARACSRAPGPRCRAQRARGLGSGTCRRARELAGPGTLVKRGGGRGRPMRGRVHALSGQCRAGRGSSRQLLPTPIDSAMADREMRRRLDAMSKESGGAEGGSEGGSDITRAGCTQFEAAGLRAG